MEEYATKKDLDGLGNRVTDLNRNIAVQENELIHLRKDIDSNEQCITSIFRELAMLKEQIGIVKNKILGGVAMIMFFLQLATVVTLVLALR